MAHELGLSETDDPVDLSVDNKSAIEVAYNPEHHGRMKHVERRHFFVRECVENHQVRVPFVSTVDTLADFFTKPLPARVFFPMRDTIMNVPPPLRGAPTRGTGGRCESVAPCGESGGYTPAACPVSLRS